MLFILRSILLSIYFVVVSLLVCFICLLRPFHANNSHIAARIFAWGGLKILGMRVELAGADSFKDLGPAVIVGNHQSNLDLFTVGHMVPQRTQSVGKRSLLYVPIFGLMYWLAGNVLINRGDKKQAWKTMSETTNAILDKALRIWVFAEGTRNRGNNMLPMKLGAFKMALDAHVPVIPVCVSSYYKNMDLNRWRSGVVRVQVLHPIDTSTLEKKNAESLRDFCQEAMQGCIEHLDAKGDFVPAAELPRFILPIPGRSAV